ncbi:MAG: spore germination protein [Eubacteriaceae bacterium]
MNLSRDIQLNIDEIKKQLAIDKSFDIIGRQICIGSKSAYLVFVDGFAKDEIMLWIINILQDVKDKHIKKDTINKLLTNHIPYIEVETFNKIEDAQLSVLSGAIVLVIDGEDNGIIIDAREYPIRSPQEPDLEKVTRGARDGLVETIVFNTSLIRRRIRDPNLVFQINNVGKRSKTDVVIGYIDDIVDQGLLEKVKKKIDDVNVDALVMAEKTLVELLIDSKWYNPLPQVKFTERPDVVAAHLMEGHIAIIVDTSPSVMLLPVTLFHFTQHAEDYYQNMTVGTFLRWMRFLGMILSLLLVPTWLLLVYNKNLLPDFLQFIGPKELGVIPIFIQFLLLEFGLAILRLASIHTPSALSTSLGIIGALLLGEFAEKVGWIIPETVLYMVISAIGTFANPSIEFGMAITIFRIFLLISTGLFNTFGFIIALMIISFIVFTTKSFDHKKYTWPLFPFDWSALSSILFRKPIPDIKTKIKKK